MPSGVNLRGRRFGKLLVVRETAEDIYLCKCKCGREVPGVFRSQLTKQVLRCCFECSGLKRRKPYFGWLRYYIGRDGKRHQKTASEMLSWLAAKNRTCYRTTDDYEFYGGRGIRMCPQWRAKRGKGFLQFVKDLGPRPVGYTLDRKNPNDHYRPENAHWGTAKDQALHKRNVLWPDGEGEPPIAPVPKAPKVDIFEEEEALAAM